jgi:hypothetical protein
MSLGPCRHKSFVAHLDSVDFSSPCCNYRRRHFAGVVVVAFVVEIEIVDTIAAVLIEIHACGVVDLLGDELDVADAAAAVDVVVDAAAVVDGGDDDAVADVDAETVDVVGAADDVFVADVASVHGASFDVVSFVVVAADGVDAVVDGVDDAVVAAFVVVVVFAVNAATDVADPAVPSFDVQVLQQS